MLSKDAIVSRLNELIKETKELLSIIPPMSVINPEHQNPELIYKYQKWRTSCLNFIRSSFGRNHHFFKQFETASAVSYQMNSFVGTHKTSLPFLYDKEDVARAYAILLCIQESVEQGLVSDAKHLYESSLFSNLIDQGLELLEKGYRIAAAIYGRISIENSIRGLCDMNQIQQQKSVSDMLVALTKAQVISLPLQREIQAKYDIGNMAAHGRQEFTKCTDKEVQELLEFVRDKLLSIGT